MSVYLEALIFAGTAVFLFGWPVATYGIAEEFNYPDWALIPLLAIPPIAVYMFALHILTTR